MSEPVRRAANGSEPAEAHGELEPVADDRLLPVPAPVAEARPLDRPAPALPAPVLAATGGFLAGVATFVVVRLLRRRRPPRIAPRVGAKRARDLEVAGSRSFLVDVHLLKR